MSCSQIDYKGIATTIAKNYSSLFGRGNNNELLGRVKKKETSGSYVTQIVLLLTESMRTLNAVMSGPIHINNTASVKTW